jgi:cytochrome bd-type quinol oxidase subunit 2
MHCSMASISASGSSSPSHPAIARDLMMASVAPIWDGNETWLVLGGLALFAAFPFAFAIIFPALYFPILAMVLSLIFRGEVLAPVLVIIGFYSRVGAALIVVNMLFALGLAHRHEFLALTKHGSWALELQGFFLLTALALAFMGPGRYSINRR